MHANNNVQEMYSLSIHMLRFRYISHHYDDIFIEKMSEIFLEK